MFIPTLIYSQELELEILNLTISNIHKIESDVISSHDNHGPTFDFELRIVNKTDSPISLYPANAKYILKFTSDFVSYNCEFFPLDFMDNKNLEIPASQATIFSVSNWVFLGTPIYSVEKKII
jgi:hypothetical protein